MPSVVLCPRCPFYQGEPGGCSRACGGFFFRCLLLCLIRSWFLNFRPPLRVLLSLRLGYCCCDGCNAVRRPDAWFCFLSFFGRCPFLFVLCSPLSGTTILHIGTPYTAMGDVFFFFGASCCDDLRHTYPPPSSTSLALSMAETHKTNTIASHIYMYDLELIPVRMFVAGGALFYHQHVSCRPAPLHYIHAGALVPVAAAYLLVWQPYMRFEMSLSFFRTITPENM